MFCSSSVPLARVTPSSFAVLRFRAGNIHDTNPQRDGKYYATPKTKQSYFVREVRVAQTLVEYGIRLGFQRPKFVLNECRGLL